MNTSTAEGQTSAHTTKHTEAPNIDAIKAKHKANWEDGDYAKFAKFMEDGASEVLDSWNIAADKSLLDVGCGSGQTAIPAAKKGIKVTGVDIAENLIQHARERAQELKLNAEFEVGDAENLPCSDQSYDVIISMFGAMFAPRPEQVTNEFSRVLKSGGQLIMANWTPTSMPARMFKCVGAVVPPPPGYIPPVLWGDEETVKERLTDDFTDIKLTRKLYPQWHYPFDTSELVNLFRVNFGPVKRAFEAVSEPEQKELHSALEEIYRTSSETKNDILTITHGEYLEIVATRR